ncbi:MAG TPA: SDR family NAD(P)-dependent oxidoreductase [Steroidobacteraceae bacterium]|nr:SDR family NAD(P)-dependent oxidoreductase [Steroidobacteraceae bacterium]
MQSTGLGRLAGKRAIVTGAGSGIGRASAQLFAREQAAVLAIDIDGPAVDQTVAAIVRDGGRARGICADAGSEADVRSFVATGIEAFGGLDVLFANAGIAGPLVPLADQTVETWLKVLRVNLIGPFLAIREVAPHFRAQGSGTIVCTASVAGLRANAGPIPYSASKAAVISLVQTVANEFYGTGIRINAICPGLIETAMTQPLFEQARARERGQDRAAEPARKGRCPRGDRAPRAVSGERGVVLRQRPGTRR